MKTEHNSIFAEPEFLQLKQKLQTDLMAYAKAKGTALKSMSLVVIAADDGDANAYHAGCVCPSCTLNHLEVMEALAEKLVADTQAVPHGTKIQ